MIKAVIFDLDGVVVSTDNLHYKAWKKLADRENIYFDKAINNRLRGVSRQASLDIILERSSRQYSLDEQLEMMRFKNDLYVELLDGLSQQDRLPLVTETLMRLREAGILTAIGSASKNTKKILAKIQLTDMFDAIADGTDVINSKPDPEVFLCAASKLSADVGSCIVVEDAVAGIEAAKRAGMFAYAIGDAVNHNSADWRCSDLSELCDFVTRISAV